jgi:integrase/recombinase XerD
MRLKNNQITFKHQVHRNQNVIFCYFPYSPETLKEFKSEFPSATWSRENTAWFLPDTTLYRNRLNIPLKEFGIDYLEKMFSENQNEFRKFHNAMVQKMFAQNTIETYLREFAQLLILIKGKNVYELTTEQLNSYFLYCIKTLKHSENQVFSRMNAVKSYFTLVLNKATVFDQVIRPKPVHALPKVLSKEEVKCLFSQTENLKHILMLKMVYGMGLRVSEIVAIKIENVDIERLQLFVDNAKGKKDRYVNFPISLLTLYQDYLKTYQPTKMLFEGQFGANYTARSVQAVFSNCMKKANITKSIGIHGLRHSFATHLLEAGTDMVFIQKLLGHKNVKTTEIYAKVSTRVISKVQSPLDTI